MSWQSKTSDFREKLEYLMKSKEMSDVTIIVDKKSFQTHSWLLSMYSETFYDIFNSTKTMKRGKISLTDVNADTFEIFLEYIYSDILAVNSSEVALSALMFADKYKVAQMKAKCVNYLAGTLPTNIITEIFEASTSSQSSRSESRSQNTREGKSDKSSSFSKILNAEDNIPPDKAFDSSLESSVEEESEEATENLSQTLPDMNHSNTYPTTDDSFQESQVRDRRPNRYIDISNIFREDFAKNEKFENLLEFVSAGNWESEVELNAALRKWGRQQFQQHISSDVIQKLRLLLQQELIELKEKRYKDFYRESQNKNRSLYLYSKCTKNWISSSDFPYIIERFRPKEFDLYVYGVSLSLKYNSNVNYPNISLKAKLKITNVTRNTDASKEISVTPDGCDRAINLRLLHPVYVGKGEICEIVLKSQSELKNGEFIYCGEMCCLDHRLEKLSTECNLGGHFNAIITLLP